MPKSKRPRSRVRSSLPPVATATLGLTLALATSAAEPAAAATMPPSGHVTASALSFMSGAGSLSVDNFPTIWAEGGTTPGGVVSVPPVGGLFSPGRDTGPTSTGMDLPKSPGGFGRSWPSGGGHAVPPNVNGLPPIGDTNTGSPNGDGHATPPNVNGLPPIGDTNTGSPNGDGHATPPNVNGLPPTGDANSGSPTGDGDAVPPNVNGGPPVGDANTGSPSGDGGGWGGGGGDD
jgi:hypothetical protein